MRTLKDYAVAAAFTVLWPAIAVAFDETDTVDLAVQIELLRIAEAASRATARTIAMLDTAYLELRSDEFEAIDGLVKDAWAAHKAAEATLERAETQLALARKAVERILGQIRIEGAEAVEIGGEVRAARTLVLGWQRLVETETAYLAQLRSEIARLDALAAVAKGD
jgi:hypothetical protein